MIRVERKKNSNDLAMKNGKSFEFFLIFSSFGDKKIIGVLSLWIRCEDWSSSPFFSFNVISSVNYITELDSILRIVN